MGLERNTLFHHYSIIIGKKTNLQTTVIYALLKLPIAIIGTVYGFQTEFMQERVVSTGLSQTRHRKTWYKLAAV